MADIIDLEIYQGDDFSSVITVYNPNGTTADITGYSAISQIRSDYAENTDTIVATMSAVVASPNVNLGLNKVTTTGIPGGKYLWDLQITSGDGTRTTIAYGKVLVRAQVSL